MRHYLATLHKRPHHHQKRFAILTSGIFTLLIFGIWALINFGGEAPVLAEKEPQTIQEANPFGSFTRGVASVFQAFRGNVNELKEGLQVVDLQSKFEELKKNTLDNYGQ